MVQDDEFGPSIPIKIAPMHTQGTSSPDISLHRPKIGGKNYENPNYEIKIVPFN